jgi:futalosine hydrolase
MRILLVTATAMEVAPIASAIGSRVHLLTTGIGMVATAVACARALTRTSYDLAIDVGVCGAFDRSLPPGSVVHVTEDRIAELGAEDGDGFLTMADLQLPAEELFVNVAPPTNAALAMLPTVRGITVNTVHGNPSSIDAIVARCRPQVETMEGAAFMSACLAAGVPFAQVRAVSNFVERRNRDAWRIAEAITNLGAATLRILDAA